MAEEKKVFNLEEFVKQSKKLFGKDSINIASKKEDFGEIIPVTPFSLRNALGIGGFAKKKFYIVEGESSGGKSTTCYDVLAMSQKHFKGENLLIDKEYSYTKSYGETLGIDNDRLLISSPKTLEDMYESILLALEHNIFDCIVVDSQTAFAPAGRFEGNVSMGMEARINSDKMRLVMNALAKSNTCLIFIMQIRSTIGGYGDPNVISGGQAIPFYAHGRIRITRSKIDRELRQNIVKFTIMKNKMAVPFKVGTVVYKWGIGFDFFSEIAELALEAGIIKNEGKSYFLPETDIKLIGKPKTIAYLNDNPEYTKKVIEPLVQAFIDDPSSRKEETDEILQKDENAAG